MRQKSVSARAPHPSNNSSHPNTKFFLHFCPSSLLLFVIGSNKMRLSEEKDSCPDGEDRVHISTPSWNGCSSTVTQTLGPIFTKPEPFQKMSILRKFEDFVLFVRSSGHLVDDRVGGVEGEVVVGVEEDGWHVGVDWAAAAKPQSLTHSPSWHDSHTK